MTQKLIESGVPRKPDGNQPKKTYTFSIDPVLYERMKVKANHYGQSLSVFVERALLWHLRAIENGEHGSEPPEVP